MKCYKCGMRPRPGGVLKPVDPAGTEGRRWACAPSCFPGFRSQEDALLYALEDDKPAKPEPEGK